MMSLPIKQDNEYHHSAELDFEPLGAPPAALSACDSPLTTTFR